MSEIDVLCAARAYLDLTFTGLEALPRAGHEEFAHEMARSPGGGALNAIGAAASGSGQRPYWGSARTRPEPLCSPSWRPRAS